MLKTESPIVVKTRVIAATHRDLEETVKSGLFRQDLLYRLNILPIHLPPLRLRPADIQLLAKHFLQRSLHDMQRALPWPTLEEESLAVLSGYDWPGNVRELRNMMTRLAVCLPGEIKIIDSPWIDNLLPQVANAIKRGRGVFIPSESSLAEAELILIEAALTTSEGNRIVAAKALGIGERTLRRKLNNY